MKMAVFYKVGHIFKSPILSGFLWTVPSLCVLKSGLLLSRISGRQISPFFKICSNKTFAKILTLPHSVRKHPQDWDSHQSATNRNESERKWHLRRLVIIESGLRLSMWGTDVWREISKTAVWIWVLWLLLRENDQQNAHFFSLIYSN